MIDENTVVDDDLCVFLAHVGDSNNFFNQVGLGHPLPSPSSRRREYCALIDRYFFSLSSSGVTASSTLASACASGGVRIFNRCLAAGLGRYLGRYLGPVPRPWLRLRERPQR